MVARKRGTRSRVAKSKKEAPKNFGRTGRAGLLEAEAESERIKKVQEQRKNQRNMPWRYWLPADEEGEIVILDESLEDVPFFYEHGIRDQDGKWGRQFEICVKEHENCPLCDAANDEKSGVGRSTYVMFLSILDLRGFETKDGDIVEQSRKLLAVKGSQINDFVKVLKNAEENNGTLRGTYLLMSRGDQHSASTGTPTPLDNGMLYDYYTEDELEDEFWNEAFVDEESGKTLREEGSDLDVFEYDKLFQYPDADSLAKRYGGKKRRSAGSQSDIEEDWDEEDEEDEEEDEKPKRRSRSRKSSAKKTRSRRPSRANREEDEEDDIEEPPPRTRSRRKKAEEEPEEEEDEKPRRRRAKKSASKKTSKRKRKVEVDEEDDDEYDGEAEDELEDEIPF